MWSSRRTTTALLSGGMALASPAQPPPMPRIYTPALAAKSLIPHPSSATAAPGLFQLAADTAIVADGDADVARVASLLAERLRNATGLPVPVRAKGAAGG